MSYVGKVAIDSTQYPIGNTLFGICSDGRNEQNKRVILNDFTSFTRNITIYVKFINGNNITSGLTLAVGSTLALPVENSYMCAANEIIGFTYEESDNPLENCWHAHKVGATTMLIKSTAEWNSNPNLIPEKNTLLVYLDHGIVTINGEPHYVPGIKLADGLAYAIDQPFIGDDVRVELLELLNNHINDNVKHITSSERTFWNNKLNCDISGERLILNRQ